MSDITFDESGHPEIQDERTAAAFIIRIQARYGLTEAQAIELATDAEENGAAQATPRAEFWRVHGMIERGFLVLRSYGKNGGDLDMAERCLWLLLGFPTLAGADSLAGIVRKTGKNKATVNKCLQHFQKQIPELPILDGQREEDARNNMKQARMKQIQTN